MIPTSVPPRIRLPQYYTTEPSRPQIPNFADYPVRVDGTTIYEPKTTNYFLSNKRKEAELNTLQTSNLELTCEVNVEFQSLNPHPVFRVSKVEHTTKLLLLLSKLLILNSKDIFNFQV